VLRSKARPRFRGHEADIDASASDIFSNLQFGAMGTIVATKGNWGFGTDLIWMSLGTTVRDTNVDFDQGAFAFYGLRRLAPAADVTFGLRVNALRGQLAFKTIGLDVKGDQTWVDPVAGLRLRTPADRLLQFRIYSEIGGFGAGSDLTWQLFPSLAINFTDRFSLDLGYRWLDIDYSTGERNQLFTYDVLTQGPVVGVGFRF
jgi:opacity protein-like surface antigen